MPAPQIALPLSIDEILRIPKISRNDTIRILVDAVARMEEPRVFVSEPAFRIPGFADQALDDRTPPVGAHRTGFWHDHCWLDAFDAAVTRLANAGASVIDPTFLRALAVMNPKLLHASRVQDFLFEPLAMEQLIDIVYLPEDDDEASRHRVLRQFIHNLAIEQGTRGDLRRQAILIERYPISSLTPPLRRP